MTACPKRTLIRDPKYLEWIREQPCFSASEWSPCYGAVEAAHIRYGSHAGKSEKPGDDVCIPLCRRHHILQHEQGEVTFWMEHLGRVLQDWRHDAYRRWQEGK